MEILNTERGFAFADFEDANGSKCSIQKSSAAMHDAIWLGIEVPYINVMIDGAWKDIHLPDEAVIGSRMHLTQKMVKELLPMLQRFVDTGELPASKE